jgi:branched-chain amino acid transport system permease protein
MTTMSNAMTAADRRYAGLSRNELAAVIAFAVIVIVAPFVFYPIFLMRVFCYALFACAYNLLFGYGGLLAFGHAAFFGAAAYVAAHTAKMWGVTPEVAILLAGAVSTVLGALFGWLAIRRQGLYFAMITLALAQIVYFYAVKAPWTHGEDGIQSVPRGHAFGLIDLGQTMNMYWFVVGVFTIGFLIIYRAIHSPFGQTLKAIRENEPRAMSLGYNTDRFKLVAFTISAGLTGIAGATKAIVFQLASLVDVHFQVSGDALLMVLMGGIGTVLGPVVGAIMLVSMQTFLAGAGSWVLIIQGAIFVACILALRKGVVGSFEDWLERRAQRK